MKAKYEPVIGLLGNVFEWYSFALFMPFLPIISRQFFPFGSDTSNQVISFLVLSAGMFVRPLGALVFGPIGDKFGRAKAITFSILLMVFSTFGMAILPGYASIGIAAPILMILFRILQGISLGGEFTSVMVHSVESAPAKHRGFFGSLTDAGSQLGVLLGGTFLVALYAFFSNDEIYAYAWRIPFACSLVLLPFGFLLPSNISERKKEPLLPMLMAHKKEMLCAAGITAFTTIAFQTLLTFMPNYLNRLGILSLDNTAKCSNVANIAMIAAILFAGYMSDKFGRKPFLTSGIIGCAATIGVMLTSSSTALSFWITVSGVCGAFLGVYYASRSAFFAEAFPRKIRCTAVSISFSASQAVFGGLAPTVNLKLIQISPTCSVVFVLIMACVALCALSLLKDRTGEELR